MAPLREAQPRLFPNSWTLSLFGGCHLFKLMIGGNDNLGALRKWHYISPPMWLALIIDPSGRRSVWMDYLYIQVHAGTMAETSLLPGVGRSILLACIIHVPIYLCNDQLLMITQQGMIRFWR